jgi:hypothetical protein
LDFIKFSVLWILFAKPKIEVQDPKLIFNSLFLTKQAFDDQVQIHKRLPFKNFYDILEYGEDDVKKWLVGYSIKNQDIQEALHNLFTDLRDLESEFFNIAIWHGAHEGLHREVVQKGCQQDYQ